MFVKILLLAFLTVIGSAKPYPASASMCTRSDGHYDVCDTMYSYIRCRGPRAAMAVDCQRAPGHYCEITNDQGHCDGLNPPQVGNSTVH
ncbi:hypothetical protein F4810DRAFT_673810 [Camillea tinctor]|nr:hypothetical protein F4810DRAFT_673810 [Camillea tinctor]